MSYIFKSLLIITFILNGLNIGYTYKIPCINNTMLYDNYCECPLECSKKIRNNTCIIDKCYDINNDICHYKGHKFTDILRLHILTGYTGISMIIIGRYDIYIVWFILLIIQIIINIYLRCKQYNDDGMRRISMSELKSINIMFMFLYTIKWLSEMIGIINKSLLDGNGCIIK